MYCELHLRKERHSLYLHSYIPDDFTFISRRSYHRSLSDIPDSTPAVNVFDLMLLTDDNNNKSLYNY
jgi:hypothetical protein